MGLYLGEEMHFGDMRRFGGRGIVVGKIFCLGFALLSQCGLLCLYPRR
jgi:hypothetical protein